MGVVIMFVQILDVKCDNTQTVRYDEDQIHTIMMGFNFKSNTLFKLLMFYINAY